MLIIDAKNILNECGFREVDMFPCPNYNYYCLSGNNILVVIEEALGRYGTKDAVNAIRLYGTVAYSDDLVDFMRNSGLSNGALPFKGQREKTYSMNVQFHPYNGIQSLRYMLLNLVKFGFMPPPSAGFDVYTNSGDRKVFV